MPIINKVSGVTLRKPCFQGSQQQNVSTPVIPNQGLKQDTVSFNGGFLSTVAAAWRRLNTPPKYVSDEVMTAVREAEQKYGKRTFFKKLRELCEHGGRDDIRMHVEAHSHRLTGEHKDTALSLYNLIEHDPGTDPGFQSLIPLLRDEVGISIH
jgi:hypothetical protein